MKNRFLLAIATLLLFSGCASNKMVDSVDQELISPSSDRSQMVFVRYSSFGGAVQSSVYDVTDGAPVFIGILSSKKKIAYEVAPGKRVFMVVSEAADFMEANLSGGKTYYAMVTPRMGAWKARFSMYPVRTTGGEYQHGSEQFLKWLQGTKFVDNTPVSQAWYEANEADIATKQQKYWVVWQEKSEADMAERTLNPEDGV